MQSGVIGLGLGAVPIYTTITGAGSGDSATLHTGPNSCVMAFDITVVAAYGLSGTSPESGDMLQRYVGSFKAIAIRDNGSWTAVTVGTVDEAKAGSDAIDITASVSASQVRIEVLLTSEERPYRFVIYSTAHPVEIVDP